MGRYRWVPRAVEKVGAASEHGEHRGREAPSRLRADQEVDRAALLAAGLQPDGRGVPALHEAEHHGVGRGILVGTEPGVTADHRDERRTALVEQVVGPVVATMVAPAPDRTRLGLVVVVLDGGSHTVSFPGSTPVRKGRRGGRRRRARTPLVHSGPCAPGAQSENYHTKMVIPVRRAPENRTVAVRKGVPTWDAFGREIGVRLQRARERKGLSQERTAHLAGIAAYTYQKFEKGESRPGAPLNPRLSTLVALCQVLDLRLQDLVPDPAPQARLEP